MIHHLSRYGRVVGVDSFEKPLLVGRQRGYDLRLARAEELPFADASFELVTLLDVVEHCDDDVQVLRECYRVCAPGGFLAITGPAFQWLWTDNDAINGHRRRYTVGQLRRLLETAGFQPRRLSYAFFLVFPLAAALLVLRRLSGRRQALATPSSDEAYQVEMEPASPLVNSILGSLGRAEAALLGHVNLPVGTSILAVAQKPASSQTQSPL
jgi:SAM-dependent methyltransferase